MPKTGNTFAQRGSMLYSREPFVFIWQRGRDYPMPMDNRLISSRLLIHGNKP
jgi:hypothetical protein